MNTPSVYACLCLLLHAAFPAAQAAGTEDVSAAIAGGTASLGLRYRYETVDQDGIAEEARASTLRTRFTWTSADIAAGHDGAALRLGLEADYVSVVGSERYNSTANGETGYPVVADPEGFDLNQAFLTYEGKHLTATGGRQRILHGGQRFVGGVGWRQNEQTYDAVRMALKPADRLTLDYAYVANVNRVFGPDDGVQPADWRSNSHFLTGSYQMTPALTLGAFGYLMDFDNDNGVVNSNATFGVEAAASFGLLSLSATAAHQTDYADSPLDYSAGYLMLEAAVKLEPVTLIGGYELLGSDDGATSFRTPLATLHKFQGWADQFLITPPDGIRDLYLGITSKLGAVTLSAYYHDFAADEGSSDYGSETDLAVAYSLTPRASVELKYADYDADAFATDTVKTWITLSYSL